MQPTNNNMQWDGRETGSCVSFQQVNQQRLWRGVEHEDSLCVNTRKDAQKYQRERKLNFSSKSSSDENDH